MFHQQTRKRQAIVEVIHRAERARRLGQVELLEAWVSVIDTLQGECEHQHQRDMVARVGTGRVNKGDLVYWCADCNKLLRVEPNYRAS
jgi:hypothetical protein